LGTPNGRLCPLLPGAIIAIGKPVILLMAPPPVCKGDALFSKTLLTAYCYLLNFKRLTGNFHHKYLKFLRFFAFKKGYHGSSSRLEAPLKKNLPALSLYIPTHP